jgi:hypothetical protein
MFSLENNIEGKLMKDDRGLYYYPFPQNKNVRMYVRDKDGAVWFRLWNADDPELWGEHGWVPYEAVKQAQARYEGQSFDPDQAYDLQTAKALIEENR